MPAGRLAGTIASTARAEAKPPSRQPGGGTPGRAAGPADPEPVHPEAWDREPTNESPPELSWYTWHRSAREPASEDAVREAERQLGGESPVRVPDLLDDGGQWGANRRTTSSGPRRRTIRGWGFGPSSAWDCPKTRGKTSISYGGTTSTATGSRRGPCRSARTTPGTSS